jgi:hypothetical protein
MESCQRMKQSSTRPRRWAARPPSVAITLEFTEVGALPWSRLGRGGR